MPKIQFVLTILKLKKSNKVKYNLVYNPKALF